ncbi:MAG TPA: Ig-like domain-containing protein, partial [Pseudonocardiaceae bacterium]|nr:Ig-like domain-containing protein [Pseudonocardiaceae bacterium]
MAVIVRSAAVRVNDSSAPSVAIAGGGLTGANGTVRGTQTVSYNASDNVGIKGVSFAIDGVQRDSALSNCDFTRRVPCPNLSAASQSFDTSRLDDGPHMLTVTATDSAGNSRTTGSSSFVVDNGAPAAPSDVVVDQGEAWRSQPTYSVRWTNPTGQVTPIVKAHYLLCEAARPSNCQAVETRSGTGISSVSDVLTPAAGDWLLGVYLEDQLGNVRPSNASTPVHLRFDDTDPGLAAPATPARWIAATEYDATLRVGTPSPPSGIAGYSVTTDGTDPNTTVDVGPEGAAHLANLPEGRVTVKARAVSNSGVASAQVGSGLLLIDRSTPYVGASGAPDPSVWQASAVTLSLAAGDQIGLSGMEDGSITYAVDGGASQVVHGSLASISLSSDGAHTMTYKATDAAGNESAESTVSFKIDATAPVRPELSDPGRWLNADDASGYVEHLSLPVTPRSGLQGYSVSTDGSEPDGTVDAGSDLPLPDLPDGVTTVRARAVSGSGLASDSAGVVELQVDKRPPTVGASGVPGAGTWTAQDVDLDIRALDQPGLSGMDGGRIVYSVDGGEAGEASGGHARITVSGDGDHAVRYWAEDAAGNRSAAEVAQFVLDAAVPGRAQPEGTNGWISPAAGRYLERIGLDGGAAPPSGIAGYSVTIDGSDPDESLDTGPDGNFDISELADGI